MPLTASTVQVHDAYLSFDVPGVPFLEPAHANVLLKGYNDNGEWSSEVEEEKGQGRESEAYKRSVWARCSPGVDFAGSLPRELEVRRPFPPLPTRNERKLTSNSGRASRTSSPRTTSRRSSVARSSSSRPCRPYSHQSARRGSSSAT